MYAICSDLEGVWVPEVWINVSKKTGIDELKLTTRDINDYNVLMNHRLTLLKKHHLTLHNIQQVIGTLEPLEGGREMLNWLRTHYLTLIVSDTFEEFASPLMDKLGQPALFCNKLVTGKDGTIENYILRQPDQKRCVVEALRNLNYTVIAIGDSYNDISMLKTAHHGILFRPPQKVVQDYPELPVVNNYEELKKIILQLTA